MATAEPSPSSRRHWGLVIFAARESLSTLQQTLNAALLAAPENSCVDVLVNGQARLARDLATQMAGQAQPPDQRRLRIWSIPLGDKANAWNQYLHQIWDGEEIAFFIDGYVRLNPDALQLLGDAVVANPQALGGTGVPTMGRSAKALREDLVSNTGYHGNFCCITGKTIQQMREQQIRLPRGLYRTDSLMGALLSYALDPGRHAWEDRRILVHAGASWQVDVARWWHIRDLQAYVKRYFRQIRGRLENAAFADHLVRRLASPASLPATACDMVLEWVKRCPDDYRRLAKRHFLIRQALQFFQSAQLEAASGLAPQLVWQHEPKSPA